MEKKTAVEWLAFNLGEYIIWEEKLIDLVEQAKEIEKEQMFKALIKGNEVYDAYDKELEFEEYYNETYETQETN